LVTVRVRWDRSYRVISARLPRLAIFERVSAPGDLAAVLEIEALTNPRLRDTARAIDLVPERERVAGPGSAFVMAPFAYPRRSRFSDGSFGVYYAARELPTAIAETKYHRALFLSDTNEPPGVFDHRVIEARIAGTFADAAREPNATALLDPDDYAVSQRFARSVRDADTDGVVWPSVRRERGRCVGAFRPSLVHDAHTTGYIGYRWDGTAIADTFAMTSLSADYPADPGAR
jgi:hypothetical protein